LRIELIELIAHRQIRFTLGLVAERPSKRFTALQRNLGFHTASTLSRRRALRKRTFKDLTKRPKAAAHVAPIAII